jgi:hypothetical protein
MAEKRQDLTDSNFHTKRGIRLYKENPSLKNPLPMRIKPAKPKVGGDAYMIVPDTGEVLAKGAFAFIEDRNVDGEEFVKIYLDGVRKFAELTKAGALLFEFVYHAMSGREGKDKDKDTLLINYLYINEWDHNISERTYQRGLRELIDKEFLYKSYASDHYFINVRFMFNGNRIALIQSYQRQKTIKKEKVILVGDEK